MTKKIRSVTYFSVSMQKILSFNIKFRQKHVETPANEIFIFYTLACPEI